MASKKRNKKYRPKLVDTPLILKIDWVFEPIDTMISRLEIFSEIEQLNGRAVFTDRRNNSIYYAVPALEGFIEFFDRVQEHHNINCLEKELSIVERIANKLKYGVVFFDNEIAELKLALLTLRRFCRSHVSAELGAEMSKRIKLKQLIEEADLSIKEKA